MLLLVALAVTSAFCESRSRRDSHSLLDEPTGIRAGELPEASLQVVVSLKEQRIALYDAGKLLAQSVVSTGMKGHPTPTGIFSVIQREKYHESNIYSNAPMPLMQRLTWSGIALHAAVLPGYPASHGCIRLSYRFAKQLWGATKIGTRVIVSREAVAPIEVTHPVLFRPSDEQSAETASSNPLGSSGHVGAPIQGRPYGETITANNSFGDVLATTPSYGADGATLASTGSAGQTNGIINPAEPVSIFINARERRLFIRQRFKPILDLPLTIRNPGVPFEGTYVFTGWAPRRMAVSDGQWSH